ncbi:MAG: LysE family translocator [Alphaproteobacteria bacterium]|nr:LysE family translocator [Alphaproteobacteria bacterium]
MSPGPDLALTIQNSIKHGRRTGIFTAGGIVFGNLFQITCVNLGLGAVIAHSTLAFTIMKYAAAAYLVYLGVKALRSQPHTENEMQEAALPITGHNAFTRGMLCNVLNPKAALFWLSFFTVIIQPGMPLPVLVAFIITLQVTVFAWFSFVAFALSHNRVRQKFTRIGHWVDRITGGLLIALGVGIVVSRQ